MFFFANRNAVKKFVYENQGLVRRMYGDMRHIFVMQSEMENEIDFDDIKTSADKYSKAFNMHNKRQMKAAKDAERKNFRSDSEPYFRPLAQRPSAINSKQKTKPPKVVLKEQSENDALLDNMIKSNIDAIVEDLKIKEENFTAEVSEGTTTKTTSRLTSSVPSSTTTTSPSSGISKTKDELLNDRVEVIAFKKNDEASADKVVANLFNNISSASLSTTSPSSSSSLSTSSPIDDDDSGSKEKLSSSPSSSTLQSGSIFSNTLEKVGQEIVEGAAANDLEPVASSDGEIFFDTEALDRNNSKEPQTTTTETQLFQDTVHKEKEPVLAVVNRRGV